MMNGLGPELLDDEGDGLVGQSAPSTPFPAAAPPPAAAPGVAQGPISTAGVPPATSAIPLMGTQGRTGHPYPDAEKQKYIDVVPEIGKRFVSEGMKTAVPTGDPMVDFSTDHRMFMDEIGHGNFKIPTIGGGLLDIARFFVEVMRRGGVQRVIDNRAFKMIARNLELPRTITSAAYVLRVSYERILYYYEQRFVHARDPRSAPPVLQLNQSRKDDGAKIVVPGSIPTNLMQDLRTGPSSSMGGVTSINAAVPPAAPGYSRERPKRKAAETASNAVSTAAANIDPLLLGVTPPSGPRRRGRPPSSEKAAQEAAAAAAAAAINQYPLTSFEERLREDVIDNMDRPPDAVFNYDNPRERERIVLCLACGVREQVAWALGTMNALSFDSRRNLLIRDFPGLLDGEPARIDLSPAGMTRACPCDTLKEEGLTKIHPVMCFFLALVLNLESHHHDMVRMRESGLHPDEERRRWGGPRASISSGIDLEGAPNGAGAWRKASTLQQYRGDLLNALDPLIIDFQERASVAGNILRNLSFVERNAALIAECMSLHDITSRMLLLPRVSTELRENLLDTWLHAAPYMNVGENGAAEKVLPAVIDALDPFLVGTDCSATWFPKAAEIISKLAASVDRNETALTAHFGTLLPRLVDVSAGKDRKYAAAGVAALCNLSVFDWPARGKIARCPRAIGRLISMLKDSELAPRAALTLHNLAEAPNNRGVLMSYERDLVEKAMEPGPAADTVASLLHEFTSD